MCLSPEGGALPTGELAMMIDRDFGSYDDFVAAFTQAAGTRFGSGWAWLSIDADGHLFVSSTANQDNPLMKDIDQQ